MERKRQSQRENHDEIQDEIHWWWKREKKRKREEASSLMGPSNPQSEQS